MRAESEESVCLTLKTNTSITQNGAHSSWFNSKVRYIGCVSPQCVLFNSTNGFTSVLQNLKTLCAVKIRMQWGLCHLFSGCQTQIADEFLCDMFYMVTSRSHLFIPYSPVVQHGWDFSIECSSMFFPPCWIGHVGIPWFFPHLSIPVNHIQSDQQSHWITRRRKTT